MKTWLLCLITLTLFLGVQHSTAQQQIDTSRITSSEYSIVQLDSVLDAYMMTQQLAEAEKWAVYAMDQVTKMDLKKLNPNTPEYLAFSKIYSVTMATYSRAENYDAISELCKHLIRKFDKVLGLTDPYYEQLVSYYQAIARNTGNTDQLIEANTVQKKIYKIKGWEETEVYLRLLLEVADLHLTKGDFSTSFDSYEYAEPIIARVKGEKSYEYMLWLNKMGEWYRLMGMFDEAIYHFKKAVQTSIYLGGGKDYSTASLMINLGRAYSSQNNYQSADTLYSKAINIYKKLPTNEQLTIAYNTALSMRMDNYVNELLWRDFKGEVIFEDELEDSEMENICHEVLAFRKKYFGTDHPEYANALVGLYKLRFAQKKYWEADKYLKKALSIREKYLGEKHFDYLELLFESCKIAEITGDIDLAVQNYRKANKLNLAILNNNFLTQTEDQRMQLLSRLDNKIIYFYSFAARHVRSYPSLAKDVIDVEIALKGLVLESNIDIRARIANSESDSLEALYREWNSLRQYIAKAYNLTTEGRKKVGIDLDSLEKKAYGLERKMGRLSVKLPSSFQQKTPLDYEHLKKNLKSDEVFIDFVAWTYYHPIYGVGEKSYSALVIRPDDDYPQWVYLTNESTLQKVLKGEVELNGSNYITDKVEAEYLYELIWLPIEDLVLDMKHLYLSPSSLLNKVAFGALLTDYDQGKRLIEDKQIHYFSTLRDFFYTKQEVKKGEETADIVLVGGIDFGNTEKDSTSTQNQSRGHYGAFSYLEGTKKEVDSIQHQFEHYCWDIQKLEDKNASEEQIKQLGGENAPKILHVATHGFFIDNKNKSVKAQNKLETQTHPLMRSGIALSGANNAWLGKKELDAHTDDGILTAYEVSNMDLHQTNLVVLSACETGRGDIDNTEGVMGLQRAFKIAGVDQMIISLWKVPDKQTYELMTFFYDNYLRGDTAHQAFQKAQQKMNKKYENPYYWAAFVLIE